MRQPNSHFVPTLNAILLIDKRNSCEFGLSSAKIAEKTVAHSPAQVNFFRRLPKKLRPCVRLYQTRLKNIRSTYIYFGHIYGVSVSSCIYNFYDQFEASLKLFFLIKMLIKKRALFIALFQFIILYIIIILISGYMYNFKLCKKYNFF